MDYLIATNRRDLTSDYIIRELKRRGLAYHRLNTETISSYTVAFDPIDGNFSLRREDANVALTDVKAAYFRRPELPSLNALQGSDPAERAYCQNEWAALLKSLYLFLDQRWFSHPSAILLAEDKPRQLRLARKAGFKVPETLITNDIKEVAHFRVGAPLVGKPMVHALLNGTHEERVIFTSQVTDIGPDDESAISAAPIIFQREIRKRLDVRITVVADRVFPVGIHSQSTSETSVDWRRGSEPRLKHEVLELPQDVERACVEIVAVQNLRFGAIDLVLDTDGQFWFLECNPNGQWAWIENRTGLPIAAAIVDELQKIANA